MNWAGKFKTRNLESEGCGTRPVQACTSSLRFSFGRLRIAFPALCSAIRTSYRVLLRVTSSELRPIICEFKTRSRKTEGCGKQSRWGLL